MLKAFQIKIDGKILDYRLGKKLDLNKVKRFFIKKYNVRRIWSGGRHILGILEKNNKKLFLKLSTTEGISAVTKNEYEWNEQFNKLVSRQKSNFWVPKNEDCGLYNDQLFYLITDKFEGKLLTEKPEKSIISDTLIKYVPSIIKFSELIQSLNINLPDEKNSDYKKWFFHKTKSWFEDIPKDIVKKYQIFDLFKIVESNISILQKRPRHGDFTPWHMIKLKEGRLGLIDGEHAIQFGVEYYDIGYFIQRVFSVLENQNLAEKILSRLLKNNYNLEKLRVILAARAIGGFLDESLKSKPNYMFSNRFKDWVINQSP